MLFIILAIYNSFSIPIEIAYAPPSMEGAGFYVLNSLIDLVFLMDIIVSFRTTDYIAALVAGGASGIVRLSSQPIR